MLRGETFQLPETLTAEQFVERSRANGVVWREGRGGTLITVVDWFGVTAVEMRLMVR